MKYVFRLFLIFGLFSALPAAATHVAGAEIQYRYIGDSTGIPRHYQIILKLYRDNSPFTVGLGATAPIDISSSCYPNSTVTLNRIAIPAGQIPAGDGGYFTPDLDECVSSTTPGYLPISLHVYKGTVTLPGTCVNFKFSWDLCCRNNAIDNLLTPGGQSMYVEALLNNTLGENTSPQFVTPAAKAFCLNNFFVWSQATVEPDGDSVHYNFANAKTIVGVTPTNINYVAPYTFAQPITTAPGTGGMQVNAKTGTFTFTTGSVQEICVVVVEVKEYRFNPLNQAYIFVGSSQRDMQVVIAATCKASVQDGPKVDVSLPGFGTDTIGGALIGVLAGEHIRNDSIPNPNSPTGYDYIVPTIGYVCGDSLVDISFDVDIQCVSISPDGTDFRLVGPDTITRPVIEVIANCGVTQTTDQVQLKLYRPLTVNGDYLLYIKVGNDGNTLTNKCGFQLTEFYTMMIKVTGCFEPVVDMRNVTVDTNFSTRIQYEIDTNSFPVPFFDRIDILRSDDNGANYNFIASKYGQSAITDPQWKDLSTGPGEVNSRNYRYKIIPVVNAESYNPSRDITSILLDTVPSADTNVFSLRWNRFNGWNNPTYRVMFADLSDSIWTQVSGQGINPTIDTNFLYTRTFDSGMFALRVEAFRIIDTTYESISNWFIWSYDPPDSIIVPPPVDTVRPVVIPNVFTPNGDDENDYFAIQNIEDYDEAQVQIFHRWGALVFESDDYVNGLPWNGTKQNEGTELEDGVYFYVLRIKHYDEGIDQSYKGTIHLMGRGN